jgi:hypothetical protein
MSKTFATDSTSQLKQQQAIDPENEELQVQIQARAYQLYEERGRVDGWHEEDWYQAENEVRNRSQLHKAA